jgi:hypothetical protein
MKLNSGSPALNQGSTTGAPSTDQRGFTRDAVPDLGAFELDQAPPTVTINQKGSQSDGSSFAYVQYDVVFNEPVTGFDGSDVALSGTAGPTTAFVSGSGSTYTVTVSGMTSAGAVVANVLAGGARDVFDHNANLASTSSDNSVDVVSAPSTIAVTTTSNVVDADPLTITVAGLSACPRSMAWRRLAT